MSRKLEVPDHHLYFQAPGGQCRRLVGIDEDLSFYEGAGEGPDVTKAKEALKKEAYQMSYGINRQVGIKALPEEIRTTLKFWQAEHCQITASNLIS